jgi:TPR repeat protein
MKKIPILLFIVLSITFPSYAGIALFPYSSDSDLREFGENSKFNNVYKIFMTKKSGENFSCSAVKVDINLSYPVYITAAHCLKDVINLQIDGGTDYQPTHFVIHPLYESNPFDDLAAFWNPNDKMISGYSVHTGDVEASTMSGDYINVGFGRMRGHSSLRRQAYYTCPVNINQDLNLLEAECSKDLDLKDAAVKPVGKMTTGDRGGGLFLDNGFQIELLGISSFVHHELDTAYGKASWRRVDKPFLDAVRSAFKRESFLQTALSIFNFKKTQDLIDDTHLIKNLFTIDLNLIEDPRVLHAAGLAEEHRDKNSPLAREFFVRAGDVGLSSLCEFDVRLAVSKSKESITDKKQSLINTCLRAAKFNKKDARASFFLYSLYNGNLNIEDIFVSIADSIRKENNYKKEAEKWLDLAIENGSFVALRQKRSHEATKQLALYGDDKSQYELALSYFSDEMCEIVFVERSPSFCRNRRTMDVEQAVLWLKHAVDADYADAQFAMAKLMEHNFSGVMGNAALVLNIDDCDSALSKQILSLYEDAAHSGHEEASILLGDYYHKNGQEELALKYWASTFSSYHLRDSSPDQHKRVMKVFKAIGDGQWKPLITDGKAYTNVLAVLEFEGRIEDTNYNMLAYGNFDYDSKDIVDTLSQVRRTMKLLK